MTNDPPEALPDGLTAAIVEAARAGGVGVTVTLANGPSPRNIYVSDEAVRILGWPREVLLQRNALDIIASEARAEIAARLEERQRAQEPGRFETVVQREDGGKTPISVSVAYAMIAGERHTIAFFFDISDRVAERDALVRSEARLRMLIEAAPDAIVILREGRIQYINPAGVHLLGYDSVDELVGRAMSALMEPSEAVVMGDRIAQVRATGKQLPPREYRARRRDGTFANAEITSFPIEYDGAPAVIALARDVTERKRFESELARADRLAAIGTLAAGVAHEINNPLTAMTLGLASLEHVLSSAVLDPAQRGDVERRCEEIRRGANRVASIVRDLAAFTRSDEERSGAVDLREVVASAERVVAHELRHRARFSIDLERSLLVLGNAGRLEQVFVNLLLNAAQSFAEDSVDGHVIVRGGATEDGRVVVEVVDNGAGIPRALLPRIFDPFFTTKPVGVGTGLGLSITHRIVTKLGGDIGIESELGRGTVVRLRLIRASDPSVPRPHSPESTALQGGKRAKLLVVDDESSVSLTLKWALDDEYDVVTVTDGDSALEQLRLRTFDVIVCDLLMPRMTGVEVYEAIAREHPGLERRVVFMTGGAFSARTTTFLEAIPNVCLEKPFSLPAVREAIQRTLLRCGPRAESVSASH